MCDEYTTCNIQEVNRLRQEAHYFRLGGLLSQLAEFAGPRLGVDGADHDIKLTDMMATRLREGIK